MEAKKKKIYEFKLLSRRAIYMRFDFILVSLITVLVLNQFGAQMMDKENLIATGCLILTIFVNGVLLLLNYWSVAAHQFYAYSTLADNQIEKCTHVLARVTNQKQNTKKQFITPLLLQQIGIQGKISKSFQIEIQKKRFMYK